MRIVSTWQEYNQAVASGEVVIYRAAPLASTTNFNTASGVSGGGLGVTSSSVSIGLPQVSNDAFQSTQDQQQAAHLRYMDFGL
ncbi:hypothetical protein [Vibrio crassostreae]|uniref:hypothetical protein n=1 Tax=Vibrio crassostreae TaxID=246167 RepID=UPI001B3044DD|nr:hypothetical protein [Vibrio crassostreae]